MNIKVQQARRKRERAFPEVKRLVKKHGRTTVQGCLNQLRDFDKKIKLLADAKREVARLKREVK